MAILSYSGHLSKPPCDFSWIAWLASIAVQISPMSLLVFQLPHFHRLGRTLLLGREGPKIPLHRSVSKVTCSYLPFWSSWIFLSSPEYLSSGISSIYPQP